MLKEDINKELNEIVDAHGGVLRAEDVVSYAAERPESALHSQLEWNDREAGHQYRLQQARQIIRLHVTVVDRSDPEPIRAFVSLASDRVAGGGYRRVADVLGDEEMRAELLLQAMRDLERFRRRYSHLQELAALFAAMDKATVST